MTYEELNSLTPDDVERLQKENDQSSAKKLFYILTWLFTRILDNRLVKLYIIRGEPLPISETAKLEELSKSLDIEISFTIKSIISLIVNGMQTSWILGEAGVYLDIKSRLNPEKVQRLYEKGLFTHRENAMNQFINRKSSGLTLSKRVWNLEPQIKMEIESLLQLGVFEGRGAALIASDLKKHLKEPDRLFRRIRDVETGKLKLSKAAQNYNPGQGVYRSSYKNALRLSRNEINAAYRVADFEQAQSLPFVIGTNISLSNSHFARMGPTGDMCDSLQGTYPKDFFWHGWHVLCLCKRTSVLISNSEFGKYVDGILGNSAPISPTQITAYPESIKSWIDENKHRYKPDKLSWIDENKSVLSMMK
jgi:hypothetical protein